jgi:SAM-dependent methyltransferase
MSSSRSYLRNLILRQMNSPRWQWLRRWIGPFVLSGDETNQWLRVVMNQATDSLVQSIEPSKLTALEISGGRWNRPNLFRTYRSVDYPEFDICAQQLPEKFDLILAEQVFEHLLWPYRAGKNVYSMLNPGGYFLISTPFLLRIHNHPFDCSRWTETGMKHFLAECGFQLDDVSTGSWGNRSCVRANLEHWRIYQSWRHSLENEPDVPIVIWALARKRDE